MTSALSRVSLAALLLAAGWSPANAADAMDSAKLAAALAAGNPAIADAAPGPRIVGGRDGTTVSPTAGATPGTVVPPGGALPGTSALLTPGTGEASPHLRVPARRGTGQGIPHQITTTASSARDLVLDVSQGELVSLSRNSSTVVVADPNIADIQAPAANRVFIFGKHPGRTTVVAMDAAGAPIATIHVVVKYDTAELQRLLRQEVPNTNISANSTPAGIVLTGKANSADVAALAKEAAQRFVGEKETVISEIKVTSSTQVNLRVRVAEVSRNVTKELGFNWESVGRVGNFTYGLATGRDVVNSALDAGQLLGGQSYVRSGSGAGSIVAGFNTPRASINNLIDALASENIVTILAEPNITAISGEPASFLAGGEFPIPIAQGLNAISIEFKQFGVGLDFVPTVLSSGRISMRVRPEVSELSDNGAITLNNIRIPGLAVRRAETTIELGSGESFAIAGLIQNNSNGLVQKYPGLGDLPIIGALFRSSRFQRNESELVIIVTPYVVRPVADPQQLRLPTDGFQPANDIERIFIGRLTNPGPQNVPSSHIGANGLRLRGDAGFIVE